MPAEQTNALAFNPNGLDFTLVSSYDRLVHANIERVWENVLDWEHLPHLHSSSFTYCDLVEAGNWGWRTWSDPEHRDHIELAVDTTRYVARSYRQQQQFSEIWTDLQAEGENTRIHVEFHVADVAAGAQEKLGDIFLSLYQQLWDEDEMMMQGRQQRLSEQRATDTEVTLGTIEEVMQQLPLTVQLKRGEFRLIQVADALLVHSTLCPHNLGPLTELSADGQTLQCPWHGYRFDVESGRCTAPAGATCKLPEPPLLVESEGQLVLKF